MKLPRAILFLLSVSLLGALPPPSFTLPPGAAPKKYTVELTVDPNRDTFEGFVQIEIEVAQPQAVVWLNAKDLTVREATVRAGDRTQKARAELAAEEFLAIETDSPVGPGNATISIRYQGRLNEKSVVGPYRKRFNGDWYVYTTFTPIDARRAFPCFDEPRFKTPWELTIRAPDGDAAFSNARDVSREKEPDGTTSFHFAPTEPLPAEVVAFAVGPFGVLPGGEVGHGTQLRIVTPRGRAVEGSEAVKATGAVLPRLEAYTGIPYRFGKLDEVALVEGAYGAVENPGMITFVQRSLLLTPGGQVTAERQRGLRHLIAHELAHQWFGDLVTQADWQDVWLSEGFATWLSGRVIDEEEPAARKRLAAVVERERIMTVDAGPKTRPVRVAMHDVAAMKDVYSRIVYQKGAAVLWMLDGWLGEEHVQDGLRLYLKQHEFGVASTTDLAEALHAVSHADVAKVLHSFLDQTGIPVVRAQVECAPGAAAHIVLEQENSTSQWSVPVCWKADGGGSGCEVLDGPRRAVALKNSGFCPAWMYPNAGATGYYRTEWSTPQLEALSGHGLSQLTAAERLTLVYDLRALRPAGAQPVLLSLSKDPDPEIAKAAIQQ